MPTLHRRNFLLSAAAPLAAPAAGAITVDPLPVFDFSPYFYMQFMEPLGVTDSSVAACWDDDADGWRKDFVAATQALAPDVLRWGGIYSRYYRWREGVGPAARRPLTRNYAWGGWESNRVGLHEFVDLCRRAGAHPLYCVNFLGDGIARYAQEQRSGDAAEAADWVAYANDPGHAQRRANGAAAPFDIKLWQLGNETSYGGAGFTRDDAIRHTIAFAQAMRARDKSIQLIGWGDHGRGAPGAALWAPELIREAGSLLDFVAIHMMGMSPRRKDTLLRGNRYQQDPAAAWDELLELSNSVEDRVREIEQAAGKTPIAITEGHLSLVPHNANPILLEWLAAVYHARCLNIYHRHGARVRIATIADFAGNRWTVNALLLQTPRGVTFPTPAGSIAQLYKRHNGRQGVALAGAPRELDIAASRTDGRVFLHVLNTSYRGNVEATLAVAGRRITAARAYTIAPQDPRTAVGLDQPAIFTPREQSIPAGAEVRWRFAPASVTAVELDLAPE